MPSGVRGCVCREVVNGGVGSCHPERVGVILHVGGHVPGLLYMSSFIDWEGDESWGDVLSEF